MYQSYCSVWTTNTVQSGLPSVHSVQHVPIYIQSYCPVWTTQCTVGTTCTNIQSVVLSSLDYPVYTVQSVQHVTVCIQSHCPVGTTHTVQSGLPILSSLDYPYCQVWTTNTVQSGLPSVKSTQHDLSNKPGKITLTYLFKDNFFVILTSEQSNIFRG